MFTVYDSVYIRQGKLEDAANSQAVIEWVIGAGCLYLLYLARVEHQRPVLRQIHAHIEVIEGETCFELVAENNYGIPITATFDYVRTERVRCQGRPPMMLVIPGGEQLLVARFMKVGPKPIVSVNWAWVYGSAQARPDYGHVYRLPYASGESYTVSQGPGGTFTHFGDSEQAVDWHMPEGTPVLAARGGVVADLEREFRGRSTKNKDIGGNYVFISHDDGTIGEYFHLRFKGVAVEMGQRVEAGELLGYSGNTGYTNGPHLHFMVYKAVNGRRRKSIPMKFLVAGTDHPQTMREGMSFTAP